ncbi:hypothetical protein QQX98_008943 [Neonectria punicea]|uniref:Kinesin light chain n=1 Tax=Neonectria punicea TaxID=979145 RepID=A0ABR1GTS0_9HYPO
MASMVETQWQDARRLSALPISDASPADATTHTQEQEEEPSVEPMAPDSSQANTNPPAYPTTSLSPEDATQVTQPSDVTTGSSTESDSLNTRGQTTEVGPKPTSSFVPEHYAYSEPVPDSKRKKRVYPRAPVFSPDWTVSEYAERFRFVKDELQKTVNEDVELRDQIKTPITYWLCMVGITPADAVPSIVIIWDDAKRMKALQALFNSRAQYKLRCGGKGSLTNWFSKNPARHIPPLKLVYFLHKRGSIIRMALFQLQTQAFFDNDTTYCGGLIKYQGSSATLGVSIQVDDVSAYLTVNHIFPPVSPGSNPPISKPHQHSIAPPPTVDSDDELGGSENLWQDDSDEYEYDIESGDDSEGQVHDTSSITVSEPRHPHKEDWEALSLPPNLDPALPYLDWSLTRPVSPSLDISYTNLFFLNGLDTGPSVLDTIRSKPRYHLALVKMVSGVRGILLGRILSGSSYIQSLPGQKDCEVFTVILDTPEGIRHLYPRYYLRVQTNTLKSIGLVHGECGSVVVDHETNEVYGHVVGSNPLGHVLLVPLEHVFSQVKISFRTSRVRLSPSSLEKTSGGDAKVSSISDLSTSVLIDDDGDPKRRLHIPHRKERGEAADQVQQSKPSSQQEAIDRKSQSNPTIAEVASAANLTSMTIIADKHHQEGRYGMAVQKYWEILDIQEKTLGNDHPSALTTMNKLGVALDLAGKYNEALRIHEKTHDLRSRVLGQEHPDTLDSLNNIALVLESQGQYGKAEKVLVPLHELQSRIPDVTHIARLTVMNNLAVVLESQGKYSRAQIMHEQTLKLRRSVLGEHDPDTLTSMNNLMLVFDSQGKCDKAEEMGRLTLSLRERVLGPEHPDTLTSMGNLANALASQEKYDEAEDLGRRTLALRVKILGREHPDTLTSMNNLAIVLESKHEFDEAEQMLRQTVALRRRHLGEKHPDTVISITNLDNVLESRSKQETVDKLKQIAARARDMFGGSVSSSGK